MCRSIKLLHNLDPPTTPAEIEAAALQFVRKVSGARQPSAKNEVAFAEAVAAISAATQRLLDELVTGVPPKDREELAAKARARWERDRGRS